MHFRPVVTPYIFLGVDRVITEAADQLDESEVLSRVGLVARKHLEYVSFFEAAEAARGRQDFHRWLGVRQSDQTENRPNRPDPHKCPHFAPPTSVSSEQVFHVGRLDGLTLSRRDRPLLRDRYVNHVRVCAIVIEKPTPYYSSENFEDYPKILSLSLSVSFSRRCKDSRVNPAGIEYLRSSNCPVVQTRALRVIATRSRDDEVTWMPACR